MFRWKCQILRPIKMIKINDKISGIKTFAHTAFFFLPPENVLMFLWVRYPKKHHPETIWTSPDHVKLLSRKSKSYTLSMRDKLPVQLLFHFIKHNLYSQWKWKMTSNLCRIHPFREQPIKLTKRDISSTQ